MPYRLLMLLLLSVTALSACTTAAPPATSPVGSVPPAAVAPQTLARLRQELERVLAQRGITLDAAGRITGKAVSGVPERLYFDPARQDLVGSGNTLLSWSYAQPGDYDCNSEVNIADLTPVGQYLGRTAADADWAMAKVADGDGNGEVNIADITPIGQNFGTAVAGYVIEVEESNGSEWRQFGYIDFAEGAPPGPQRSFGYLVQSGMALSEFRVAAVGGTRDFAWEVYPLTDSAANCSRPSAAYFSFARPAVAYLDLDNADLCFAQAQNAAPASAAEWDLSPVFSGDLATGVTPELQAHGGFPALVFAYFFVSPSIGYAYATDDTPQTSDWFFYGEAFNPGFTAVDLDFLDGNPWFCYDDAGLRLRSASTAYPTVAGEWSSIAANPLYFTTGDFLNPSLAITGYAIFSAGVTQSGGTPELVFNRAAASPPTGPLDFIEYSLAWVGSTACEPSLALAGGLPCIAYPEYNNGTLNYHAAGSQTDNSAANWTQHQLTAAPQEFEHPQLFLLDGRPAVCWAGQQLHFAWALTAQPAAAADWAFSSLSSPAAPLRPSVAVVHGLPLIAFCQDNGHGGTQVSIAVAHEI